MKKRGSVRPKPKSKGQISIFIIIAIVIIVVIAILFIANDKYKFFNSNSPDISSINTQIEECTQQRALDAVRLIGLQGGYTALPDNYLETNLSNIAYGYYEGDKTLPTKTTIEKEINNYIEITTPYCIEKGDFLDYNVTLGRSKSTTTIEDNDVKVSLIMHATITKGTKTITTNGPYDTEVPIRLGNIYTTAGLIVDMEVKNPNNIELTKLSSLDYYITVLPVTDTNLVYIITDNKSVTDGIPYSFLFANKFKK